MTKTPQTACKSIGGKAPTKQLVAKAARRSASTTAEYLVFVDCIDNV